MEYIVHRRFKQKSMSGDVNLPIKTLCESLDGIIYYEGGAICTETSENAHNYFAINEDGHGLERGNYTRFIRDKLSSKDEYHDERFEKFTSDELCLKYIQVDDRLFLFGEDFFKASIEDLLYMIDLIQSVEPEIAPEENQEDGVEE